MKIIQTNKILDHRRYGKNSYMNDLAAAEEKGRQEGGSGEEFNVNDIILAPDLGEKCAALTFSDGLEGYCETDWTFEDICTQDSCGMLQKAFEDVENNLYIYDFSNDLIINSSRDQHAEQEIILAYNRFYYTIYYSAEGGKYIVLSQNDGK